MPHLAVSFVREEEMRATAITLLVLGTLSTPAFSNQVRVLAYGGQSCGDWTKERHSNSGAAVAMESWTLGYITGFNAYGLPDTVATADVSGNASSEALFAWLDNYCRANPLDTLHVATDKLINELLGRLQPQQRP